MRCGDCDVTVLAVPWVGFFKKIFAERGLPQLRPR